LTKLNKEKSSGPSNRRPQEERKDMGYGNDGDGDGK